MMPSQEQRQFAAAIHDLLSGSWTEDKLEQMGVTTIEESGGGRLDLMVAHEELGHHAVTIIEPVDALTCAAQLLGLGRALLEMSVDYATQRVQFGQPVGRFQAIKHKLADVHIALEFARPVLYAAQSPSTAKIVCGDAAYLAARTALQVHGAIGYTEEFELSRYFHRVRELYSAWGTPSEHRALVMEALQ